MGAFDYREEQTQAACNAFLELIDVLGGPALEQVKPSNRALVATLDLPRHEACFTQKGTGRLLRTSGKWQDAAAKAGRSKADGKRAYDRHPGFGIGNEAAVEAHICRLHFPC